MKSVLVPLAPGFEEVEAVTVVDILRRAGIEVIVASTVEGAVEGRNGIRMLADTGIDEVADSVFDMVVLPGGAKGTENLKRDERIKRIVERHLDRDRFIAAICAAPTVLSAMGVTGGRTLTCHPSVREELKGGERVVDDRVVLDGKIITSQGPGTAMEFAFRLVEVLCGGKKAEEVNSGVLARL